MKSRKPASSPDAPEGREDEKLQRIVEEVDLFFKSVHADIEDWKFSIEDHGDGTRIFVRFQIHINSNGVSPAVGTASVVPSTSDEVKEAANAAPGPGSRAYPRALEAAGGAIEKEGSAAESRADLDLASFVELWKRKRATSPVLEFHKEGAPHLEAGPRSKSPKRAARGASLESAGKGEDASAKASGVPA
jgi:hypothetical protein